MVMASGLTLCCSCNGKNAKCARCRCVKAGTPCVSCLLMKSGHVRTCCWRDKFALVV